MTEDPSSNATQTRSNTGHPSGPDSAQRLQPSTFTESPLRLTPADCHPWCLSPNVQNSSISPDDPPMPLPLCFSESSLSPPAAAPSPCSFPHLSLEWTQRVVVAFPPPNQEEVGVQGHASSGAQPLTTFPEPSLSATTCLPDKGGVFKTLLLS